ncbi:BolA family protein [Paracoccus sp. p3-h83]|uniref:BolA family protein n=1 Tax=Paracoccus sp. p3-h83 TaxID=3342805 RepID=UPI0035BA5530
MDKQDSIAALMRDRLAALQPTEIEVRDDSEQHRGHAGWREGGQTHFQIRLRAPGLAGLSRVARHRAVHQALGADLVARIHALSLDLG